MSKQAVRDFSLLKAANLTRQAKSLIDVLAQNPFQNPPPYEKLVGDLRGFYSRRINIKHRLVYMVDEPSKTVRVLRMWTHYA